MPAHRVLLLASFFIALCAACGDDEPGRGDGGEDGGTSLPDAERPDDAGRDGAIGMDGAIEGDGSVTHDAAHDDAGEDAGMTTGFPRGGTRLVPTGYAAGAVFQLHDIYDRELEAPCSYLRTSAPDAAEATYHCVPHAYGELRFSDDECTEEVVRLFSGGGCQGPLRSPIVQAIDVSSCGAISTVARRVDLEAPLELETVYTRAIGSGECEPEAVGDAEIVPTLADPLSALVAAELEQIETAQPGLSIAIYAGDDGSRFRGDQRWSDGEPCSFYSTGPASNEQLCIPEALNASENVFADDACSEPIFTGSVPAPLACDAPEPEWRWGITFTDIDGCQYIDALYALDERTSDAFTVGSECMAFDPPDTWRMFPALEEAALSEVPALTLVPVGDTRLQLEHYAAQDGSALFQAWSWWDSEEEHGCDPQLFADGTTRCVRLDYSPHEGYFADADCSVPAYTTFVGGCNPPASARRIRAVRDEDACPAPITELIELELHAGDVYSDTGGCMPATLQDGQAAFVDGDALDIEDFAELELVEP